MIVPGFAQRYPKDGDADVDAALHSDDSLQSLKKAPCANHRPLRSASPVIESCCTTLDEARAAQARGAHRIELCTDLSRGGFTPPRDLIREDVAQLSIPVNVLIRPFAHDSCAKEKTLFGFSSDDFIYNEDAIQQMVDDIEYCKSVGAAGVVVGALTPEGAIDLPAMRRLVAAARPLPVTFHRAFDVCTEDPFVALDKIISLGCARLLTSGQAPTAWDGRSLLRLLGRRAAARLIVMPGSGVTPANLPALAAFTLAPEYHGTKLP